MIGDWFAQWPAVLAAIAVVFLPGLAIGLGLRLRGLTLWALAPIASIAVIASLAIVLDVVGVRWSAASAGIGVLLAIAIAWAAGIALGHRRPSQRLGRRGAWLLASGFVVGIIIGALRFGFYVGDPAAISQTNDAVFHLNALAYIAETGSASSFDISRVIGSRGFYPAAWHGMTSLVIMVSGASIPVAVNAVALVVAAGIWPVGIAWFTRVASSGALAPTVLAAALSPALLVFPLLMFQWGVLYPYALSLSLVPAAAAVVAVAPQWIRGSGPVGGRARNAVLVGVITTAGVGAIALAQPAALLAWSILAICWFTWWAAMSGRGRARTRRTALAVSLIASWGLFLAGWAILTRSTTGSHWPPFRGKLEVLVDVALNGQVMLPFAFGISILMIVGLVVSIRKPSLRWLATSWFIFTLLYVLCAAVGNPFVRRWVLGGWYADPYRIAALAALTVIPLAAIGLAAIVEWAASALSRRAQTATGHGVGWAVGAVAAVGTVSLAVAPVVQMPKVVERQVDTQSRYASNLDSFLSPDERALAERLAENVPDDALIIGNPSAGTGFAYMLSGRNVYPRTWAVPRTESWQLIGQSLRDVAIEPEVCDALEDFGSPTYVLDFGEGESTPGRYILPGMTDFTGQDGFELVDEQGDASLWRITACTA